MFLLVPKYQHLQLQISLNIGTLLNILFILDQELTYLP